MDSFGICTVVRYGSKVLEYHPTPGSDLEVKVIDIEIWGFVRVF